MGQADEGERKTSLFSLQERVTLPFQVDGEAPRERWGQCRVLGGGRHLNERAQVGSLTPLLTHISEPQLPRWHKSAMTGGLWARDDASHHLGRPGTKEGQWSRETEWGSWSPNVVRMLKPKCPQQAIIKISQPRDTTGKTIFLRLTSCFHNITPGH